MLSERTEIEKIELIGEFRIIQITSAIVIERDGEVISRLSNSRVITPADDISDETDEIKAVAALSRTPDRLAAYGVRVESDAEAQEATA